MPPPCTVFFTMDSVRSTPYAQLWATCDSECGRAPILKDGNACSPVRSQAFSGLCNDILPFFDTYFLRKFTWQNMVYP